MNGQCIHMVLNSKTKPGMRPQTPLSHPFPHTSPQLHRQHCPSVSCVLPGKSVHTCATQGYAPPWFEANRSVSALCLAPCFFTQLFILGKRPCEDTETSLIHVYGCKISHPALGMVIHLAGALTGAAGTASTISPLQTGLPR